ncbi:TadE/TadG family type IV pilus assembly protein [Tsuneonella sp. HG094]
MIAPLRLFKRLRRDLRGTMLIETAVIAPALLTLSIGGFEVATMVAKQSRLQSTAELATEIVTVTAPDTDGERLAIQTELSQALPANASIQVQFQYRCGTETTLSTTVPIGCSEDMLATYLHIELSDYYEPLWTDFGIGSGFDYNVERTVQVS